MLGTMLVGAWLLIQQQCCSVYGDSGSRFRNAALVDPLTRRSPLEKNFMRFGRSSPSTFSRDSRLKENFMRFGRPVLDPSLSFGGLPSDKNPERFFRLGEESLGSGVEKSDEGGVSRMRRAQDNFMRFGRDEVNDNKVDDEKTKRQTDFMRFGRNKDYSVQTDSVSAMSVPELVRAIRANENFMRFGRDDERVVRNDKSKQDSFIRFGKSEDHEETESDNCDKITESHQPGGDNSLFHFAKTNVKSDNEELSDSADKADLVRVVRDEREMLRTSRQRSQDTGFIRFGRNKRETHKHKEQYHHSATNKHPQETLGVCKSSLINALPAPCKHASCNPLYLPWPFYYQPSLYSVLPNVLATPQVSILPTPLAHKPKRSRGNLQNFIRLG